MHAEQGHEKVLPLRNTRSLSFPFPVPSLNWDGYLSSDTSECQVLLSECSLHVYVWRKDEVSSEFKMPCGIQNALQKSRRVQFPGHSSSLALQDAQQNSTYDITDVP